MRGRMQAVPLDPDELNETDESILDELHKGRATPQFLADRLGIARPYASNKLKRLVEHGHVAKVAPGLYEVADDPRRDGAADGSAPDVDGDGDGDVEDLRERLDAVERERDRLREQLEDCREALDEAVAADVDVEAVKSARVFMDRALSSLPKDAPGRTAVEDAKATLADVVDTTEEDG